MRNDKYIRNVQRERPHNSTWKDQGGVPSDTFQLIKNHMNQVDNHYLALYRFYYHNVERLKRARRRKEIEEEVKTFERQFQCSQHHKDLLKMLNERTRTLASTFPNQIHLQYTPEDKLALGVGGSTPYGNFSLMTLHAVYGIPYIPGSSLKGVVRYCFIQEKYGGDEEKARQDTAFRLCFGSGADKEEDANAGGLVFFDTYPLKHFILRLDVLTPHYAKYYSDKGGTPPTDDQEPVPITFPVVTKSTFNISIGVLPEAAAYVDQVREMVCMALTEYGIGAKTSLGYGLGKVETI